MKKRTTKATPKTTTKAVTQPAEKKVETKETPVAEKKPEVKAAPAVEKKSEVKAAPAVEKKPAAKAAPAAEKKPAAKKAPAKTAAKKVAAKKELQPEVYVQYAGQEFLTNDIVEKVKETYTAEGHRVSSIKSLQVYVKPEENAAYYVINENTSGKVFLG